LTADIVLVASNVRPLAGDGGWFQGVQGRARGRDGGSRTGRRRRAAGAGRACLVEGSVEAGNVELADVSIGAHVAIVATARLASIAGASERAQVEGLGRHGRRVFEAVAAPAFLLVLGGGDGVTSGIAKRLALFVGVVALLSGRVDLHLEVAAQAGCILKTSDVLVPTRSVGKERANLATDHSGINRNVTDTELLAGMQSVKTIGVQYPLDRQVLRRVIRLDRGCIDGYGGISTVADIDLLAFDEIRVRVGGCQLRSRWGLGLADGQDRAANVAKLDLLSHRLASENISEMHGDGRALVPASFISRNGERGDGRVTGRGREDNGIKTTVRPERHSDSIGTRSVGIEDKGDSHACSGRDHLARLDKLGSRETLVTKSGTDAVVGGVVIGTAEVFAKLPGNARDGQSAVANVLDHGIAGQSIRRRVTAENQTAKVHRSR
jgi:hypothetical protein